jgi:hypothetical protein
VTIGREADGWYACFSCVELPLQPLPPTGRETGIVQSIADEVMGYHHGWRTLYCMMNALARFFGAERVRFSAWKLI